MTHASVSRFVKTLEAELGTQLFERRHRQVALTPSGARYAEIVADALRLISLEIGTGGVRGARGKVVLEIDSDLALLWLMPRLDQATLDELDIDIEFRSYSEPPRTIAPDTDLAITWGAMDVPGYSREPFLSFRSFPVCEPGKSAAVRQDGIDKHRLLHNRGLNNWDEVLKHAGTSLPSETSYLIFHRTYLCLDAAAQGLGIAIGDDVTAAAMLQDGQLVCPCGPVLSGRQAFYLSTGNRAPLRPPVMTFRNWLLDQAKSHMHWANDQKFGDL